MFRPASLEGIDVSFAFGRRVGIGSAVSPVNRIARYFAAPTSGQLGFLPAELSIRALIALVSEDTFCVSNFEKSREISLWMGILIF